MKLEFSGQFLKKIHKYKISLKSVQWKPSCPMRTDMTKLIVAFRKFANAPDKTVTQYTVDCGVLYF
jgi:hypothetical protein